MATQTLLDKFELGTRGRWTGFASHHRLTLVFSLVAIDIVMVVAWAILLHLARNGTAELSFHYWTLMVLGATAFSYATFLQHGYEFEFLQQGGTQTRVVITSSTIMFLLLLVLLFLSKVTDEVSRSWLIGWTAAVTLSNVGGRLFVARFVAARQRGGGFRMKLAIVGADARSRDLAAQISGACGRTANVCGWFSASTDTDRRAQGTELDTSGAQGSVDDLIRFSRHSPLDEVIVVVPDHPAPEIDEALRKLSSVPVSVGVCPEALLEHRFRPYGLKIVGGIPVLGVFRRPLEGGEFFLKRSMDITLAVAALLLVLPLMAIISALIKLDSRGPVLFRQPRLGFNNNVISVYKFRTMRHELRPDPSVPQATRDDPRVTQVGRFLRRTSLDELPQLFNVLRGEMSLVGPRPHALEHNEKYAAEIDRYLARHRVKPGITGHAQVNGLRGETRDRKMMEMRVEHDLHYIENWSLLLDFKILMRTLLVGFRHPNAF